MPSASTWSFAQELVIGHEDDSNYALAPVSGLAVSPRHRLVFIAQRQDAHVRVFDFDGRFIRAIGRRGDVPRIFRYRIVAAKPVRRSHDPAPRPDRRLLRGLRRRGERKSRYRHHGRTPGRSLVRRVLGIFRPGSGAPLRLTWRESAEQPTGLAFRRFLQLDASTLPDGRHRLILTVRRASGAEASVTRLVDVR